MTDPTALSDETLVQFYEQIRDQVAADAQSGGRYRFMGLSTKERANMLLDELRRRRLVVSQLIGRSRRRGMTVTVKFAGRS
jgi:hypothetical protein